LLEPHGRWEKGEKKREDGRWDSHCRGMPEEREKTIEIEIVGIRKRLRTVTKKHDAPGGIGIRRDE